MVKTRFTAKVRSRRCLWQSGWLTGQTFFQGISSARSRIGREIMLLWPPEPVGFGPNPVEVLSISEQHRRLKLRVRVVRPVVGDIRSVFDSSEAFGGNYSRIS